MAVTIEQVTMAKTQKSLRVSLSGKWYGAYLDSGLNDPTLIGKQIEASIETKDKGGPWIVKWLAAPQVSPPSASPSPSSQPAAAASYGTEPGRTAAQSAAAHAYDERNPPPERHYAEQARDNIAPWYWPSVSNICSSAMQAGLIKSPNDLNQWALKWAQVSVAVKSEVGT